MAAVLSLHDSVTQFVNQDGDENDANPNQHIQRFAIFA
jgi:hypothetical protein